jgi:hypothetical protein
LESASSKEARAARSFSGVAMVTAPGALAQLLLEIAALATTAKER